MHIEEEMKIIRSIKKFLIRNKIDLANKGVSTEQIDQLPPDETLKIARTFYENDTNTIIINHGRISHNLLPGTFLEHIIATHQMIYDTKKIAKLPLQRDTKAFTDSITTSFMDEPIQNFREQYINNLYSIPISIQSIDRINCAVRSFISQERSNEHDLKIALGKNIGIIYVKDWIEKKHPDVLKKFSWLIDLRQPVPSIDIILSLIHLCYHENKNKYKSKIEIAKKIYNFRINTMKKKTFTDGSTTKKLQAEVYQDTIFQINSFSKKHQISTAEAIERLIHVGYAHLINTPAGQLAPSAPITYTSNLATVRRLP